MTCTEITITDWISAAANVIMAGAAIFTGWLAYRALQTWKDQLRGQANYELARRLLRAVDTSEDSVRKGLVWAVLLASARKEGRIPPVQDKEFVQMVRSTLEEIRKAQAELDDLYVDAEIILPKESIMSARLLRLLSSVVYYDVERYMSHFTDPKRGLDETELQEFEEKIQNHVKELETLPNQRILESAKEELKHYIQIR